jgi:hypothetical protein
MEVAHRTVPVEDANEYTGDDRILPGMLEVSVDSAAEVDLALEKAIAVITETATHHRTGALVTRIGAGSYIVRAHPNVPLGLIRQQFA